MAHLSQDAGLLNAFAEGKDIHRATAAEVFDTDFDSVTSEQRRRAKAVNFGLIYGMSAFGLARQLDIRLYLPEIRDRNAMRRQAAERAAINAPMQGTAADIIKKAMISIADWIKTDTQGEIAMIMQVHDELVFEVDADKAETLKQKVCELMAKAANLDVELLAEAGIGDNWDEAH